MREPSYSFRSLFVSHTLLPLLERHTQVHACLALCKCLFSLYRDSESKETQRYILERALAPIGAAQNHHRGGKCPRA
jgi:hypothetical protein